MDIENRLYIIGLHDESWGNHGDYILGYAKDEIIADKIVDYLNEHMNLLEGDRAYYERIEPFDDLNDLSVFNGASISDYLYGHD